VGIESDCRAKKENTKTWKEKACVTYAEDIVTSFV